MRSQLRGGLIISLVTLIIIIGGLEIAGYLWEKETAQGPLGWTLVASRRQLPDYKGSQEMPYYLYEPAKTYLWEDISVEINSRGLRDNEVEIPKTAETYRILNLGDSIVFGWRVELDETYGKQLQAILNSDTDSGQVEVVNAGMPGWSLEAARNFLLQEGFDYQPDAIILSIGVVNDITTAPVVRQENPFFAWLRDHTYAWPFITTQTRFLLARQSGPEAIPVLNPPQEARAYYPLRVDNPLYDQVWEFVTDMQDAAAERDIPFIVIVFPTAFQLNSSAHPDAAQQALLQRAEADGIPMIDMLPIFEEACKAEGEDACEGYENALFADIWMHPNPIGHRLAAEHLSQVWPFELANGEED